MNSMYDGDEAKDESFFVRYAKRSSSRTETRTETKASAKPKVFKRKYCKKFEMLKGLAINVHRKKLLPTIVLPHPRKAKKVTHMH